MPTSIIHQQCRWHGFETTAGLERAALQFIIDAARQAISERGAFHIVLTGGRTPRKLYELVSSADTDWSQWHVYYGDERCLPQNDAERNSQMAESAWLKHVPIPDTQVHSIPAEQGAEDAAALYRQTLAGVGMFDVVLLGLGEDGHVASLFPGHNPGSDTDSPDVLAVHDAPKPPPDRVSLSAIRLSNTRQLLFLVTGQAKREAVEAWRNGDPIPASIIAPANGVDVYVEAALLGD